MGLSHGKVLQWFTSSQVSRWFWSAWSSLGPLRSCWTRYPGSPLAGGKARLLWTRDTGPESSAYEAPKPSYSTTTTVRPCSYEAPTSTSAPSYGAPEQKKAGFPDILGFIGGILKPKKAPEPNT